MTGTDYIAPAWARHARRIERGLIGAEETIGLLLTGCWAPTVRPAFTAAEWKQIGRFNCQALT